MIVKVKLSALKSEKWHDYVLRFTLGGLATVATGLIAAAWGSVTGGLFLAFPAIFCASATLIEKKERQRKERAGLKGTRRGQEAAALNSVGAALGSFGLLAFGAIMWSLLPAAGVAWAFAGALLAWAVVAVSLWWLRRFVRHLVAGAPRLPESGPAQPPTASR
jgi:uncharacterized membrane protein